MSGEHTSEAPEVQDLTKKTFYELPTTTERPYLLINLFRMDSHPCLVELPEVIRLQEDSESQVSVALVSLDEPEKAHRELGPFLSQHGVRFPVYHFDPTEGLHFLVEQYPEWDHSVPFSLIYTRDGRLVEQIGMIDYKEVQLIIHADQSFHPLQQEKLEARRASSSKFLVKKFVVQTADNQ